MRTAVGRGGARGRRMGEGGGSRHLPWKLVVIKSQTRQASASGVAGHTLVLHRASYGDCAPRANAKGQRRSRLSFAQFPFAPAKPGVPGSRFVNGNIVIVPKGCDGVPGTLLASFMWGRATAQGA